MSCPQAFGRFADNLVLHQAVCVRCNSYFSKSLDLHLARRTSEGLERYAWHLKSASELDKFDYGEDVLLFVDEPRTDYHGTLVRKIPSAEIGEAVLIWFRKSASC